MALSKNKKKIRQRRIHKPIGAFMEIVNDFQPLTIFAEKFILGV